VASRKRTPLTIGVKDLMHSPGEMREHTLDVVAPEQYGEAVAIVPEGTPMAIELRLEGLHEGILVTCEVSTDANAECVRCLDEFSLPVRVDFQELFTYSSSEADSYTVVDDSVMLESIIRDAVVLDLPFQPVCKPDCYGLDPATGEKLTSESAKTSGQDIDPRWLELGKLLESDGQQAL
jgi:uncharacterized protein